MTPLSKITTTPLLAQREGKKWFPIEKIVLKEMTSLRWLWMNETKNAWSIRQPSNFGLSFTS